MAPYCQRCQQHCVKVSSSEGRQAGRLFWGKEGAVHSGKGKLRNCESKCTMPFVVARGAGGRSPLSGCYTLWQSVSSTAAPVCCCS